MRKIENLVSAALFPSDDPTGLYVLHLRVVVVSSKDMVLGALFGVGVVVGGIRDCCSAAWTTIEVGVKDHYQESRNTLIQTSIVVDGIPAESNTLMSII